MEVTRDYCRKLMKGLKFPESVGGSEHIDEGAIQEVLDKAKPNSRFYLNFDPASDSDHEDNWDVIGPSMPYGHVFYLSRKEAEQARDNLNRILRLHFGPRKDAVKYTPEAHRSRVLMEGKDCCPSCGSQDLMMNEYLFRDAACQLHRACGGCGSEWEEIYVIHEYKNLKND